MTEANDQLPYATWSGSFRLFGVEVKCHVLSDGQRIIEADSMQALLAAMHAESSPDFLDGDFEAFDRWRRGTP